MATQPAFQPAAQQRISSTHGSLAEIVSFPGTRAVLPEVLAALTYALDLIAGELPGYTLRTAVLAMNLGKRLRLRPEEMTAVFHATMLNALGTPRERHAASEWMGMDARLCRHALRGFDWRRADTMRVRFFSKYAFQQKGSLKRLVGIANLLAPRVVPPGLRCRRSPAGMRLARTLGLPAATLAAMQGMDERWDGTGGPEGLFYEATSLQSQICCVAQDLAAFADSMGRADAVRIVEGHSGKWYDPAVVAAAITTHEGGTLWNGVDEDDLLAVVLQRHPQADETPCTDEALEAICSAVAEVIDGRSAYTERHSHGVARIAARIGEEMGLSEREHRTLRCAALLHDIGKVTVPAEVLDHQGPLTPEEMSTVRNSPMDAYCMLRRIRSFESIALVAVQHHERLDGSGYPEGLEEHQISRLSRIVAMAEAYDSLSSARPYRGTYTKDEVLQLLQADIPQALDATTFEALKRVLQGERGVVPPPLVF